MEFTTSISGDQIQGSFFGPYNRDLVNDYVTMVVNFCKLKKCGKLFLDFRKVEGEVTINERYKLAEHLAGLETAGIRISGVVTEGQSHPVKLAETVASVRGVNVKIWTDESEARRWLEVG